MISKCSSSLLPPAGRGLVLVLVRAADTNCGHHCTNIRHAYNRFHLSKYSLIFTLLYNYIYSKLINAQMR